MANLALGTQAGGLCAQRVYNPLVHGISQAYLFLQRSATPLGAQATSLCSESDSATFEILHGLFVLLRRGARFKVPRFLRLPVFGFFFREYKR